MSNKDFVKMGDLVVNGLQDGCESPVYIDDIIDRMQERLGPLLSRETMSLIDYVKEKEKDND